MSLTKNQQHANKRFRVHMRRHVKLFEGLNSSLAQMAEALWCW